MALPNFFGTMDRELWVRVGFSMLCGFIIGLERHLHKKAIDIRTSTLIVMGTMVFIYLGAGLTGELDASRVLGQVVTGIGFLGAGAIITRQGLVQGMTSAAVVWVLAAVGAAIGFGRYGMGVGIALVTVFVLTVFQVFEDWTELLVRPQPPASKKEKEKR